MKNRSFEEITFIMRERRSADSTLKSAMQDMRARHNASVVLPMPDVAGEPQVDQVTPALITDAIEANAMRAASTTPMVTCPTVDISSVRAGDRAVSRRRAIHAAWDHAGMVDVLLPRAYRHHVAYGTSCMSVVPDFEAHRASIELRDPLGGYPEFRSPDDMHEPRDIGFVMGRSPQWLLAKFPAARSLFTDTQTRLKNRGLDRQSFWEAMWDVVEWIDEDEIVMGVLGPRLSYPGQDEIFPGGLGKELARWPNRAGMVPISMPRRVTLDVIAGQITHLTGIADMMAKLTALDVLAAEKAVFPDMVVIDENGAPQLLNASGMWEDGRTGKVNLVKAKSVQILQSSPGPLSHSVIDRMNRNFNVSAGLNAMQQGETPGSGVRTGNAIDRLNAASVDPRIQEMQRVMSRGLRVVNEAVGAVEKGYWPTRRQFFFSGFRGDAGMVEYKPKDIFEETLANTVDYAFPGTDINQLTVAVGQAIQMEIMSRATAAKLHPLIDDPESEKMARTIEQFENVILEATLQQALQGQLPMVDAAKILRSFKTSGDIVAAVIEMHEEAQARQAEQVPADDPAAQPGLSMPGMGAESTPAPPSAPPPGRMAQFQEMMAALQSATPSSAPAPAA